MHCYRQNERIEKIASKDGAELKSSAAFKEKHAFNSLKDFKDFCLTIDLNEFLGLPKSFSCIFHEDVHASAGIFFKNGKYFYKCFSPDCPSNGKALTVFHIIKKIRGKSYLDAYYFLCSVLNCSIPDIKNKSKVYKTIEINNQTLENLSSLAPNASKLLKKDIEVLNVLYELASTNGGNTNRRGDVVYSISQRYLDTYLKERGKGGKIVSRSLTFLAYLGFIEKIPFYKTSLIDIDTLLEYSRYSLAEGYASRLTMQLLLKKLDNKTILNIEKNAKQWKKLNYTKEMLSFANIAEKEGGWKANELYPQV